MAETVTSVTTTEEVYPGSPVHTWQEFAGFAIELGGYGDATLIDPYTGRRLWVKDGAKSDNPYTNLRHIINVAEQQKFLDKPGG